jgi:hypothetical protein
VAVKRLCSPTYPVPAADVSPGTLFVALSLAVMDRVQEAHIHRFDSDDTQAVFATNQAHRLNSIVLYLLVC